MRPRSLVRRARRRARRAGLSLLEALVTTGILVVLAGVFSTSVRTMTRTSATGDALATLERVGATALDRVVADLRRSGFVTAGGEAYPYLFVDGAAEGAFVAHAHEPPATTARPGEVDFGPSREAVLLLPADADADGQPDVDADGALVWGADEVSWVLVPRGDGTNGLERRVNAADPELVALGVERLVFDDVTTDPTVAFGALRVRIHLRRAADDGVVHRHLVETTVRLRNGG